MKNSDRLNSMVQNLKIVACTSYVNVDTEKRANLIGFNKVYSKPLSVEDLDEILTGRP
jgi:CheY-like chemotaxis protein